MDREFKRQTRVGVVEEEPGCGRGVLTKNEQSRTWKIPGSHAKSLKSHARTHTCAHMHIHSQPAPRAYNSGEVSDKSHQPENFALFFSLLVVQNQNYSNCIQSTDGKTPASPNDGNRNFTWLRSFSTHFSVTFKLWNILTS